MVADDGNDDGDNSAVPQPRTTFDHVRVHHVFGCSLGLSGDGDGVDDDDGDGDGDGDGDEDDDGDGDGDSDGDGRGSCSAGNRSAADSGLG